MKFALRFNVLVIFLLCVRCFGKPLNETTTSTEKGVCGYESCKKVDSTTLNVHLIPHSHDDVGWLKTVNQYYYGSRNSIQHAGVQYIIGSVIQALLANPERRFIQVETAFFNKWWRLQDDGTRENVRQLVNAGRLEIIGGAWSMNDEAATHYHSTIDQFTLGLEVINETLGECGRPKVGWQIDPFGHSREQTSIFAQLGYDAYFFSRLDFRDKDVRLVTKTAEMIWRGSPDNLGEASDVFTSVLYNNYAAPPGFCFDILCSDEPIVDDEESPDYNYESKVKEFAAFVKAQADHYQTSNVIVTMGEDFNYQDAFVYFFNMDKLIEGFKLFPQTYNDKPIDVFYSTPSCYAKAVNDEATTDELKFPVKTDDFFPYASDPHAYWTGYFTSRPTSKRFERQGNNLLQVGKQLSAITASSGEQLMPLRDAMGIMQHHDAITGTEKQHVFSDYHRILTKAVVETTKVSSDIISNVLQREGAVPTDLKLQSCLLANVSYCPVSRDDQFMVTVYNPLSRNVSHYVQLPVFSTEFSIFGPNDEEVAYQVAVTPRNFNYTKLETAPYTLVFYATNIPPLGIKVYHVTTTGEAASPILAEDKSENRFTLGDGETGVEIDSETGKLKSMTMRGVTLDVNQELLYYVGATGDNGAYKDRASGAYIFRPSVNYSQAIRISEVSTATTYRGELFDEVQQVFDDWATQVIRVYKDLPYVEFDWIVGPIPATEEGGKEVISRFSTNVDSNGTFYTDSNGREMLKRARNFRPTYNYTDEEPVSGNYYPVTSRIVIRDSQTEFAVFNDRAQGGSSLGSGEVELMVHRRCINDDAFGVGESLQEREFDNYLVVRGQHFVTFGPTKGLEKSMAAIERDIAQQKVLAPWVFVAEAPDRVVLQRQINFEFSALTTDLPENVQILTLQPWKDGKLLLRLEHTLETGEDPVLSQEAVINLKGLFKTFNILALKETTLGANQWLEDNVKLKWNLGDYLGNPDELLNKKQFVKKQRDDDDPLEITLSPMQIRTFVADVEYL